MTELAQGYLSLSVGIDEPGKALGEVYQRLQRQTAETGQQMRKALSTPLADAAAKAEADMARLRRNVEQTGRAATASADKQAEAARKVQIAEAKLSELRATGRAKASQLLSAEDALERAKKAVAKADLDQQAASKKAADAIEKSAEAAARRAQALRAEAEAADDVADKSERAGRRMAGAFAGLRGRMPTPFRGMRGAAAESGQDAGKAFVQSMQKESSGEAKRLSGAFKTGVIGGLTAGVTGAALGAASALAGMGRSAASTGLEVAAAGEQSEIAFTTMLKSSDKAKSFLADLAKFAAETPFDLPGLKDSASSLISAGIDADKVIPIMRNLGDVTSGMGTGADGIARATVALQQMNAAQKVSGEDLNQLRDAGIPVYDLLAASMGKTKQQIAELASKGKLGKDALDAMMKGLESGKGLERFRGLMDKQSQSLEGLKSSFDDIVQMGLADLMAPLIPDLKALLKWASEMAAQWLPKVGAGFKATIDGAKSAAVWVRELWARFRSGEGEVGAWASRARQLFDGLREGGRAVGAWLQSDFLPRFREVWAAFSAYYRQAARIAGEFASGMMARIRPLIPQVKAVFTQVGGVVTDALGLVKATVQTVTAGVSFIWRKWGNQIMGTITWVWKTVLGVVKAALKVVRGIIQVATGLMSGDWSKVWQGVKTTFSGVWEAIKSILSSAWEGIKGIWDTSLSFLGRQWGKAWDGIRAKVHGVMDDVRAKIKSVTDGFGSLWSSGVAGIQSAWDAVRDAAAKPINWVIEHVLNDGIIKAFNKVAETFNVDKRISDVGLIGGGGGGGASGAGGGRNIFQASGGVLPGYTPGQDVHHFYSPTAGGLHLSGGEAIMRPEWTRGIGGAGAVAFLNAAARRGRRALMAAMGALGNQAHAGGGIIGGPAFAGGGVVGGFGRWSDAFASRMQLASQVLGSVIQVVKRGWLPDGGASGTSHRGDAVDAVGGNLWSLRNAMRAVGLAAWVRGPAQGYEWHVHGVPFLAGTGTGGGSALYQAQAFAQGGDGLHGMTGADPYASGGQQFAGVRGFLGSLASTVGGIGFTALRTAIDWTRELAPSLAKLTQIGDSPIAEVAKGMARKAADTIKDKAGDVLGFQNGGVSPGGWAALSEDGRPELVVGPQFQDMQRRSKVYSFSETQKLLGGGGGGPMVIRGSLDITPDGRATLYGIAVDAIEDHADATARRARR